MEPEKKKVDESWKDNVEKEKKLDENNPEPEKFAIPEASFAFFVSTLGMQAAIALGDMPNPTNNKSETNLDQAKFLIDTLGMLKEKTKNNLDPEEEKMLEGFLYELRLRYVEKTGGEKK